MGQTKECEHCGLPITGKGKYCTAACKQAAYRQRHTTPGAWRSAARRANETKAAQVISVVCEVCGTETTVNGLQAKTDYCSDACRQKAYRQRVQAKGRAIGRPKGQEDTDTFLSNPTSLAIMAALTAGLSVRDTARETDMSTATVQKVKQAMKEAHLAAQDSEHGTP